MINRHKCYGNMFPDPSQLRHNQPLEGQAFRILIESRGIGISGRTVEVKAQQWKACVSCESYRDCYDLSVAKFLLDTSVVDYT